MAGEPVNKISQFWNPFDTVWVDLEELSNPDFDDMINRLRHLGGLTVKYNDGTIGNILGKNKENE